MRLNSEDHAHQASAYPPSLGSKLARFALMGVGALMGILILRNVFTKDYASETYQERASLTSGGRAGDASEPRIRSLQ